MHNDVLRRIIARISLDDLAADLERRLLEAVPAYRDFASEETAQILRWNVDQFVRWLTEGTPPTREDLQRLEAPVRHRLSEGMTMEDGLRIYRSAAQAGWDALVAAADDEERAALLSGADVLFAYMNAVTDVFYGAEISTAEQRAHEQLTRVLAGEDPDARDTYTPFVAQLGDGTAGRHAALAAELRTQGALAVSEGRRVAGLLTRSARWPAAALVALGEETGRAELADALDDLRALAAVAHARTGVVRIEDHLPELLLHSAPRHAHALHVLVYGPLDDELARTLEALVAHGFDKSAAAAALPVHRNTLGYRAAKIERLTGLDLDTTDGRGRAWLATLQRNAA
ncbi:helix-turn-helix domain-containing protein [Solirubrobacter ginsenosidimutans]|uniref:Helix-turn-helix domain-containing protein n=1 Tax=Solirubrobacter ginsenosidimutans TaxID=490573 RepID=A0A9X3MPQ6_9ACTN|nr:helix-turn-helix domain-containing protein [Solirubrobacter ginsenosidimutans]MDA0160149.1 helix-turn-helix domain-containing protein [Solirubrobacter ginsenosidimutans]